MRKTPYEEIHELLMDSLPAEILDMIPRKWEKIGSICILRYEDALDRYSSIIGKVYAEVLGCKSVLRDYGGITGELRIPQVKLIYGDVCTKTVHKENGIEFVIDPAKVMFSSGNLDERKRMSTIAGSDEVVVDLFAGIGYFSIPMAVYSKPKRMYSCEINPVAYKFLCQNIRRNNVVDMVETRCGDSLKVAPEDVADRVLMGYVGDTHRFFLKALHCLRKLRGIVHFHDTFPDARIPDQPIQNLKKICDLVNRELQVLEYHRVKSFAPGISHYVFDIRVE